MSTSSPRNAGMLPTVIPRSVTALCRDGVGRGTLAGPKWQRTSRGFYRPLTDQPASTAQRILDTLPLLAPSAAIGGWAAAYVHGASWLDGIKPSGELIRLDILSPALKRRSTPSVRYRKAMLGLGDISTIDRMPVTSLVRTAFDGARWAASLEEAVVFLDAMLAQTDIVGSEVAEYARIHHQLRSGARAFTAAGLAEPNVASPWESRLRVCYRRQAGLSGPLINQPVFDFDGTFLGMPDLFDPDAGLVTEYDGEQHRERRQHRDDNLREERLESANLVVLRADAMDLGSDRRSLVRRLWDGYRRGSQRDRTRDRWTLDQPPWWRTRRR
jgi:hypothetical protein